MKIHFLIHESFEAPGAIEIWAKQHNFETSYTRFYQNEELPESVDGFDYLIIMGGPQSPATTTAEYGIAKMSLNNINHYLLLKV